MSSFMHFHEVRYDAHKCHWRAAGIILKISRIFFPHQINFSKNKKQNKSLKQEWDERTYVTVVKEKKEERGFLSYLRS
jgi:hypothetical protein